MDIKPLTNEISESTRQILFNKKGLITPEFSGKDNSSDAVRLEISEAAQKQYTLSKSALMQVEMTVKLSSTMKANGENGLNTGNYLEDLTNAYDQLHKTLNENSENSNKNGKYLDEALRTLASSQFALNGTLIGRSITDDPFPIPLIDGVNPYVDSSRKQAEIFTDTFLKDYKKNGLNAFNTAMDKLSDMPKTASLSNISYNDLKILSEKNELGMLNTKSGIADVLKENSLSDFMSKYLASLL